MDFRELFGLDHFWEDFFGGYKKRKERERHEIQGLQHLEKAKRVIAEAVKIGTDSSSSAVVIALINGAGVNPQFTTQYQIEQLEQFVELQV